MSNSRKVAINTGGSQGIGAALVKAFRDRDYRVVATFRSIQPSTHPNILTVRGEVGDSAKEGRAFQKSEKQVPRLSFSPSGKMLHGRDG